MIRKPLGDERPEPPLDGDVDLGDEIDRALLVDLEGAAEAFHLQIACEDDRFDGSGEIQGVRRHSGLERAVRGRRLGAFDHADFHSAFGRALQPDVVHEIADEEDAAAARLQQVLLLPCLMALITDSRIATLTQWSASSSRPTLRAR
jgi:hypothetical protein